MRMEPQTLVYGSIFISCFPRRNVGDQKRRGASPSRALRLFGRSCAGALLIGEAEGAALTEGGAAEGRTTSQKGTLLTLGAGHARVDGKGWKLSGLGLV